MTTPKIFILRGEHYAMPSGLRCFSTRTAAASVAAGLVNEVLQFEEQEQTATAENFDTVIKTALVAHAVELGMDADERFSEDEHEDAMKFLGDDSFDVWIDELDIEGPFVLPPAVLARLTNASAVIGLMSEQMSQMKGMFSDEDGQIEEAMDEGEEEQDAIASVLATSAAGVVPISGEITIVLEGGLVNSVISDGPLVGLDFSVIDYDTEGADEDELSGVVQADGRVVEASCWSGTVEKSGVKIVALNTDDDEEEA